jgi:hypothetical protein
VKKACFHTLTGSLRTGLHFPGACPAFSFAGAQAANAAGKKLAELAGDGSNSSFDAAASTHFLWPSPTANGMLKINTQTAGAAVPWKLRNLNQVSFLKRHDFIVCGKPRMKPCFVSEHDF